MYSCAKKGLQYCFWCRRDFRPDELTRDHVRPLSVGGPDCPSNIVLACEICNKSRGQLTAHRANGSELVRRLDSGEDSQSLRRAIRRHNEDIHRVRSLRRFWVAVELKRLGWSPSEGMWHFWRIEALDVASSTENCET